MSTDTSLRSSRSGTRAGWPRDGVPSSERVYMQLRKAILMNELPPNTRLVEVQVAGELGVSRTPVREALKRLLAEGFVSRDPLGGLVVHAASPGDVDEAYPVREVLDGMAARLAAQRITPEDLIKLKVIHETMMAAMREDREEKAVLTNIAFHEAIYEISGNRRLLGLGRDLTEFVRRFSSEAYYDSPERRVEVVAEHAAILEAIEANDPDGAEDAARRHLRAARAHMARLLAAKELVAGMI
jgi:DNA-binding GntR family transcriptional regulator